MSGVDGAGKKKVTASALTREIRRRTSQLTRAIAQANRTQGASGSDGLRDRSTSEGHLPNRSASGAVGGGDAPSATHSLSAEVRSGNWSGEGSIVTYYKVPESSEEQEINSNISNALQEKKAPAMPQSPWERLQQYQRAKIFKEKLTEIKDSPGTLKDSLGLKRSFSLNELEQLQSVLTRRR